MNIPNIFKQNFSYKLDINIEPNWNAIYKKLVEPKSEKQWDIIIAKKRKDLKKDYPESLFGRRYYFTEYYDQASGLTTRFQGATCLNGKQYFSPVDEFGDRGYIFDSDNDSPLSESDKKREQRHKLSVEIGEDFIRNDIYDEHVGGFKIDFDYEKGNYLFQFPLFDVFNFLFALGQRFHGAEQGTIIKWPEHIEKKFKELGINYETFFDFEPELFDIEKHDKEFFEKIGRPQISLYGNNSGSLNSCLRAKDKAYYGVKLKIFRPSENDRINTNIF